MDYENAVKHYIELRNENSRIDEVAQKEIAANKAKMEKLGVWIQGGHCVLDCGLTLLAVKQ